MRALESTRDDPLLETRAGIGEELEQFSDGDAVRPRDRHRRQVRIAEVHANVSAGPGKQHSS